MVCHNNDYFGVLLLMLGVELAPPENYTTELNSFGLFVAETYDLPVVILSISC